jgi:hypothetical protein
MSASSSAEPGSRPARRATTRERTAGSGWVAFAGTMLAIVGTLNVVYGIAAIDKAHVYGADTTFVFGGLSTWGWFLLLVGLVQLAAAFGVWSGAQWARWVGVFAASVNGIMQLLFLPAFPLLSLSLFAVDILVIYGLIQYGDRDAA